MIPPLPPALVAPAPPLPVLRVAAGGLPALGPDQVTLDCAMTVPNVLIAPRFQLRYSEAQGRAVIAFHMAPGQAPWTEARITDLTDAHLELAWTIDDIAAAKDLDGTTRTVRYAATYVPSSRRIFVHWINGFPAGNAPMTQSEGVCAPLP